MKEGQKLAANFLNIIARQSQVLTDGVRYRGSLNTIQIDEIPGITSSGGDAFDGQALLTNDKLIEIADDLEIQDTDTLKAHISTSDNVLTKLVSTDSIATIELGDNSTSNQAALTRVSNDLKICKDGGNMETEILGSYNINVNRNYIATIGNGANEATDGNLTVTVTGKEERTINKTQDITVLSDISVTSLTASISQTAFTDFNITGLSTMNVISAGTTSHGSSGDVTINYETSLSETVGSGGITQTTSGSITESYGSMVTSITGTTVYNYTGDATFKFTNAYKRKIDGDTFVDKEGGFVDHVHPVSPSRTSGTDAVT